MKPTETTAWPSSVEQARELDRRDPLHACRAWFTIPEAPDGTESVYLCGNSLGCQPVGVRAEIETMLDEWGRLGVEGHLQAKTAWYSYHEIFRESGAALVGAKPGEVVMMNSLTVNLHLMMVSFYRPTAKRFRILIEDDAFPSDSYAVQSQADSHGFDAADAIIRVKPRNGEATLRTDDIIEAIERAGDSLALVMLPGVNYYTGQVFDMKTITAAAHHVGAYAGWDLAHAAGNVPMLLHDWKVDFACWCSYKYLNSGPGAIAGCFVHELHGNDPTLPRFAGWWGNDPETRFEMTPDFVPRTGADGWQLSNPPILAMVPLKVSLDIFDRVGMERLRAKSERLTGFMHHLLTESGNDKFTVITPDDPEQRGCQISVRIKADARVVQHALHKLGVIADYRAPDVIRVSPVPLYNTFEDVWRFVESLRSCVEPL